MSELWPRSLPEGTTPMSGEHLTDLATSWTTIRNAHTPGPVGQAAMRELIGRYHDAVERYLRLKLRDSQPRRRGLPGVLDQAPHPQARRRRQQQGPVPRLPPDRPPSPDHRPLPGPRSSSRSRPATCSTRRQPRRRLRPRLARGRHQAGLVAARDLRGQHAQEPLRHRPPPPASTTRRPRSRSSPPSSASRPATRSRPKRSARPSSAPAPSSSTPRSRSSARRSIPPSPRTSRPRSSTSASATSTAAIPAATTDLGSTEPIDSCRQLDSPHSDPLRPLELQARLSTLVFVNLASCENSLRPLTALRRAVTVVMRVSR